MGIRSVKVRVNLEYNYYRSIGLQKSDITKVTLYEYLTSIGSATILGSVIGALSAGALTILLLDFVEIPFILNVSIIE